MMPPWCPWSAFEARRAWTPAAALPCSMCTPYVGIHSIGHHIAVLSTWLVTNLSLELQAWYCPLCPLCPPLPPFPPCLPQDLPAPLSFDCESGLCFPDNETREACSWYSLPVSFVDICQDGLTRHLEVKGKLKFIMLSCSVLLLQENALYCKGEKQHALVDLMVARYDTHTFSKRCWKPPSDGGVRSKKILQSLRFMDHSCYLHFVPSGNPLSARSSNCRRMLCALRAVNQPTSSWRSHLRVRLLLLAIMLHCLRTKRPWVVEKQTKWRNI